jgi:uncharacterized protein (TIGR00369 family)
MSRTRTIEWHDPQATAGALAGRSGLAFLRAMIAGEIPPPPMALTLGFRLDAVDEGFARFVGTPDEYHYNPMGSVHGGWYATLLDSALGCAVMTTCDEHQAYTTAQLAVNLTRAITRDTGPVAAEARIVHRGGRLATAEGRLTDGKGTLLAHATTTCLILPRGPRP